MQFTNTALFTFLSLAALGAARPGGDTQQSIVEQREAEPRVGPHHVSLFTFRLFSRKLYVLLLINNQQSSHDTNGVCYQFEDGIKCKSSYSGSDCGSCPSKKINENCR
jgi:hypothetical protein